MKKYTVMFTVNGNPVKGTFWSAHRRGSSENVSDAANALAKRYDAFEINSIMKAVPYEPDGIIL